jgi:hypothetical protein
VEAAERFGIAAETARTLISKSTRLCVNCGKNLLPLLCQDRGCVACLTWETLAI